MKITTLQKIQKLKESGWIRMSTAAAALFTSTQAMSYRIKQYPQIYKEGRVWRWHPSIHYRLINMKKWQEAESKFHQASFERASKSNGSRPENRRKKRRAIAMDKSIINPVKQKGRNEK